MRYCDTCCSIAKDMRRITALLSAALLDNSIVRVPHSLGDVKLFSNGKPMGRDISASIPMGRDISASIPMGRDISAGISGGMVVGLGSDFPFV
jgi:hypothetical protein